MKRVSPVNRPSRAAIAASLIVLVVLWVTSYHFHSTPNKDSVSTMTEPELVPAQTPIPAFITNKIAKSAGAGQIITALVTMPVVLDGKTVIPSGAHIVGRLEGLLGHGAWREATIDFNALRLDGRDFPIQTQPVVATIPVKSDTQILADALKALTGAGLGTALGAASGDPSMIQRGMLEGTISSIPSDVAVPITVILVRDLRIAEKRPS